MSAAVPCAPVVVLPFNRADKLAQVIAAIREARPAIIFFGVDGPRDDFPDDATRCAQVRRLLDEAIDWPCDVRRLDREQNLGCNGNTELTLDWVFSQVDRAIVLDDDCVPDPTFFAFCSELLERYAEDDRIVHIAGSNDGMEPVGFGSDSYAFTAYGSNWGWATWARAWHQHRAAFPRPHDETTEMVPYGNPPRYMPRAQPRELTPLGASGLVRPAAVRFFRDVGSGKDRDILLAEWGQQWRLSMLNRGGIAITPRINLVRNVGFDGALDSHSAMPVRDMPDAEAITFPLTHPREVTINKVSEEGLEVVLVRAVGRLARTVRARTPESLRTLGRNAARLVVR